MLRRWGRDLKTRQRDRATVGTRSFKWLSIASPEALSNWACTTEMKCRTVALMSEPRIKDLQHFALFLPFSCIESRQLATYRCKTETLEVIEKTEKTGLYGRFANPCISLQKWLSQGSGPGSHRFKSCRPD